MTSDKTVIIIGGPTASGKTAIAVSLAQYFNTEVISADSRQCYKELNIGVARPSPGELALVPHHFIATHSIYQPANAVVFEQYALGVAAAVFATRDVLVMAGGTGLYIDAFRKGLDDIPVTATAFRDALRLQYNEKGLAWLQAEVKSSDPLFYASGENLNPHRLLRALEVKRSTGKSILEYRTGEKARRPFKTVAIAIDIHREQLVTNINHRVEAMLAAGLEDEVRGLENAKHLPPLQTVGYKELFAFLEGSVTYSEAVEHIRINTRQYAKRQGTWFRRDKSYHWMPPDAPGIIEYASRAMAG